MKNTKKKDDGICRPCYFKLTLSRNESVSNGVWQEIGHLYGWYEMHHNTSWQKLLLGNPSSVINRHFESVMDLQCLQIRFCSISITCVNEPMCLRPYPVYIKMWAKAKKIKTSVSWVCMCVCCTQFCFQSSCFWTLNSLVWPKFEVWANKTITINKKIKIKERKNGTVKD